MDNDRFLVSHVNNRVCFSGVARIFGPLCKNDQWAPANYSTNFKLKYRTYYLIIGKFIVQFITVQYILLSL